MRISDWSSDVCSSDLSFISHLIELRTRLVRAVAAVLIIFVVLFIYPGASKIYDILAQPMLASLPTGTRMIATGVITPFIVPIKVTLLAAFILALPIVLYKPSAFVAPGIYKTAQRLALPLLPPRQHENPPCRDHMG